MPASRVGGWEASPTQTGGLGMAGDFFRKVGCGYHKGEEMLERPNQQVSVSRASRRDTGQEVPTLECETCVKFIGDDLMRL